MLSLKTIPFGRTAKILNISKKEVINLKEKAITDFKNNLKKICKGDN